MKNLTVYFLGAASALALITVLSFAQKSNPKEVPLENKAHRIVFQITSPDTAAYRTVVRQVGHLLEHWPTAQVEVVSHSKGISMLVKDKTNVQAEVTALKAKGVTFSACENTMKSQKLEKSQMIAETGYVPVGVVEIAERQEQGWSYLKGGF